MNHDFARLLDGMIATLRNEVLPHTEGEYPCGQAFGVIYMLEAIKLRAGWSEGFYREQLAMQAELRDALRPLLQDTDAPPAPDAATDGDAGALQAGFEAGQDRVCSLLSWLARNHRTLGSDKCEAIHGALRDYMNRQIKFELKTCAKPMFAEISSGEEG